MYFSVKKKRKKEKVSFMVSLPHHFNPVMGREILHFPSLFQSIFTLLCCALPVSHWHTNTRLKRMWSSCKKTRVEWPFFMLIPTERARIYARTEGRGFVQIDQRDICKHTNPFLLFCLCAPPPPPPPWITPPPAVICQSQPFIIMAWHTHWIIFSILRC